MLEEAQVFTGSSGDRKASTTALDALAAMSRKRRPNFAESARRSLNRGMLLCVGLRRRQGITSPGRTSSRTRPATGIAAELPNIFREESRPPDSISRNWCHTP